MISRCLIALLLFMAAMPGLAAELNFTSPSAFVNNNSNDVLNLPLRVTGKASSVGGVISVSIAVLDTTTSKWWGSNGWQEAWADQKANVSNTSDTTADWSITLNLQDDPTGSGKYLLISGFNDRPGVYHSDDEWQRYFSATTADSDVTNGIQYTTPAANESVTLPLNISGSVTSPTGVAAVGLGIMDLSNYKWWDEENLSWSEAWKGVEPNLSSVGATSANWQYQFDPQGNIGSGQYRVFAGFSDANWQYSVTTWKREFNALQSGTGGTVATEINFTAPQEQQAVMLPFTIKGNAASENGVAEVGLGIMDLSNFKWWNNGSWSDGWAGVKANLTSQNGNLANWQYTFDASNNPGSGNYRLYAGMSDRNWRYLSNEAWVLDFSQQSSGPIQQVSAGVYQLTDLVEYDWLVGCVPTVTAMIMGYWDRNGYGGLITGDSTRHSGAIDNMLFSPGHVRDYLQPTEREEYEGDPYGIIPDKSETLATHDDNSLADFAKASFSRLGLDYGWSVISGSVMAVHGWTNKRGYGGFRASYIAFDNYSYERLRKGLMDGKPAILSVDVTGGGSTDHQAMAVGFNDNTREVGVLAGWNASDPENPPTVRWIKWAPTAVGTNWGIGGVIEVTPPPLSDVRGPNTVMLENKGASEAYYRDGVTDSSGSFDVLKFSTISNLGSTSIAIATADGHRFWQLSDDGRGSAALYQADSRGDGLFYWLKQSDDTGLNRSNTVGFATADGETFWQLWNDGRGTLALVRWEFNDTRRQFVNTGVQRYDTGFDLNNTLGAGMADAGTLLVYVKQGNNSAGLFSLDVNNSSSRPQLIRSNISGMDSMIDVARFKRKQTVASDGDGALQGRSVAQRPSELRQRLMAQRPENLESLRNWGVAPETESDEFGDGVIQPTQSGNDSELLQDNLGGAGGLGILSILMGLLMLGFRMRQR